MILKRNKDLNPWRLTPIIIVLFALLLSSCHGHESSHPVARPPVLTLQVGTPVFDAVFLGGFNAYAVAVHPGSVYKISITEPTDDVDLLYFGTDSTFNFLAPCAIDNTALIGISPEDCVVTAPGNVLYLGVDGSFLFFDAASYTVDVELLNPADLTLSVPVHDSKKRITAGLYAVPVSPGANYVAAVTGLSNDADLYVFADGTIEAPSACLIDNTRFTGTTAEDCTISAASSTLYIIVDPIFSSSPSMDFTAFAVPAPVVASPANEGSIATPVALSVDAPEVGQAGFNGTSYYAAAVTPGARYTVSVVGFSNNGNLTVYNNDSTFTTAAACTIDNTFFAGTTPEDCTLTASGATLYFSVTANTQSGGIAYVTLVSPGP